MRVAIDGRLYGQHHRGLGRYLVELISSIALLDRQTEYYLIYDPRNPQQPTGLPKNFTCIPLQARVYTIAEQLRLPRLVRRLGVDLTHYPHFSVPLAAPRPYVITVHDLIIHHFPNERASTLPSPVYHAKLATYRAVVHNALRRSERIIAPSRVVADDISHFYPWARSKIVVVPLAPAAKAESAQVELPPHYVLTVGAAYPHKNLERVVDAVVQVNHEADVKLIIVGRADVFMERLRAYVLNCGADKSVIFWGEANEEELAALYSGTDAYLIPSLAEGFGLTPLEALQYGAHIVASDLPVLREVLSIGATYVNPHDTSLWARAIMESVLAPRHDSNAREVLGRYSWAETARLTTVIYAGTVANQAS